MPFQQARRAARMNPSIIREILKVTEQPGIISLAGGLPSPDTFPAEAMREASNRVLRDTPREALQYAASEGYGPLREMVAAMLPWNVDPAQVLITTGSQQGLDLVAYRAEIARAGRRLHEDRLVVRYSNYDVAHVFGSAQELARFELIFPVRRAELAGRQPPVRQSERARHLERREAVSSQPGCVQRDADLSPLPADQRNGGDIRHLLDGIVNLCRDAAQLEIPVAPAGKRERQNRYVVD